ncbi:MAG TPA: hypothetical protein VMZ53_04330 [Kofleriaceae bacterium]|nr:hypothetical protein [Kofleriaceae bacterium]
MGNGDHRKPESATPDLTVGRTTTLDDPLTTGLLAEVARSAQTKEFDGDAIQQLIEQMQDDDTAVIIDKPVAHPNVRKRG